MPEDAGLNGLAPHARVREMQTKLHRWGGYRSSGMSPVESRMR